MNEENVTQGENLEVTQVTEANAETQTAATEVKVENKKEEKTYSQKELDNNAADTRRATERETKKKLLSQLGLTLEDEDKLEAFKKAYENSLTAEELKEEELSKLRDDKASLAEEVECLRYTIQALCELTGKKPEDVDKIVKMAQGLKSDENTIEDAIKEVIKMIGPKEEIKKENMPHGNPIAEPSDKVVVNAVKNPFSKENFNLTEQGELIRKDPELARRLCMEAGQKVYF